MHLILHLLAGNNIYCVLRDNDLLQRHVMMTLTARYCCTLSFPQVSALLSGFFLNYCFIIFWPGAIKAEIPTLPIWCLASRSPDFYQILPIYYKILKTREKLLIFNIFGDLSLWNTQIILTFFAKSSMVCYNSGWNDVKIQKMALERT